MLSRDLKGYAIHIHLSNGKKPDRCAHLAFTPHPHFPLMIISGKLHSLTALASVYLAGSLAYIDDSCKELFHGLFTKQTHTHCRHCQ